MAERRDKNSGIYVVPSNDDGQNHEASNTTTTNTNNSYRVEDSDFVTRNEERDLSRGLHQRHISLIAIAGAIVRALPFCALGLVL